MTGHYDNNPFDEEEVNPFTVSLNFINSSSLFSFGIFLQKSLSFIGYGFLSFKIFLLKFSTSFVFFISMHAFNRIIVSHDKFFKTEV